jgi:hypothetical protein
MLPHLLRIDSMNVKATAKWSATIWAGATAVVVLAVAGVVTSYAGDGETAVIDRLDKDALGIDKVVALTTGCPAANASNVETLCVCTKDEPAPTATNDPSATVSDKQERRLRGADQRLIDIDGDGIADNRDL